MRKFIVFLSFLSLASCSNDNGSNTVIAYTYNASIRVECGTGTAKTYEVTEATYNNLNEYIKAGTTCNLVQFKDITEVDRAGYLSGIGKTN